MKLQIGKLYYHRATPSNFELVLKVEKAEDHICNVQLTTMIYSGRIYTRLTREDNWHEVVF